MNGSNGLRHPFSGATYEQDGEGHIIVTVKSGRTGLFAANGKWISGELEEADPQLCGWVAGPIVGNHRVTEQQRAGT
jgi:hypothetical protein